MEKKHLGRRELQFSLRELSLKVEMRVGQSYLSGVEAGKQAREAKPGRLVRGEPPHNLADLVTYGARLVVIINLIIDLVRKRNTKEYHNDSMVISASSGTTYVEGGKV